MTVADLRYLGPVLLFGLGLAGPVRAGELLVTPAGPVDSITEALTLADSGDTVRVRGGTYQGPIDVERSVHLVGEGWPTIDGHGRGSVVRIRAPEVTLSGFVIRNSGSSLDEENAGVVVEESRGARVSGNVLEDVLFGIYLRKSPATLLRDNRIVGKALAVPRRGDAIRVWYSDDVRIEGNEVSSSRDVVLWYSQRLTVENNRVLSGRYGLHFMYCDDARISGNLLMENSVGAFLMYSRRLSLVGNAIAGNDGPSGYGVGLKDMDDAVIRQNLFVANRVGAFLDNSPREIRSVSNLEANIFAANDVGVVLLPNVRRASFLGNSFAENQEQVAVAGAGGDPGGNLWRENYWSDYAGYDADGDGFGDVPYRSQKLFESLADLQPELRLFLYSPTTMALDFAALAFPVVRPQPRLVDHQPRMQPVKLVGVPELPLAVSPGWTPTAAGMVATSLLLLSLPTIRRGVSTVNGTGVVSSESQQPSSPAMIEVEGLSKRYGGKLALDRVSFSIAAGESVALWGPNGAGKTTALRALLGVISYDGSVLVGGREPRRQGRAVRGLIGFVPQEIALQGELDVLETLELFGELRRASSERIEGLLEWLGLEDQVTVRVQALSGGMRQRLGLGVALLADPPILLLDEPTANLDAHSRASFYRLLKDLRWQGKTLVFTSHRAEEVLYLADRVLCLENGRLTEDGRPDISSLDGSSWVELQVRLPVEELAEAEQLLEAAGLKPRRFGQYLVMTLLSRRKVEPLALLVRGGLSVEDIEVSMSSEPDFESG